MKINKLFFSDIEKVCIPRKQTVFGRMNKFFFEQQMLLFTLYLDTKQRPGAWRGL